MTPLVFSYEILMDITADKEALQIAGSYEDIARYIIEIRH